jgi:hypothetical protein
MSFTATPRPRPRGGITIALPFRPAEVWGDRDRWYLAGTIERYPVRATVKADDGEPEVQLGPSWCRDPRVLGGQAVQVSLHPEGPQLDTIAPDIADALGAEPQARRFFESQATFYRKAFTTWIDGAAQPATRARRIAGMIDDLRAGRRERTRPG